MKIRTYQKDDAPELWRLFYNTIHHVNCRDYSPELLDAWAPLEFDFAIWQRKMDTINPVIAEMDGKIVGYTDLQADGLIDHFFCHAQYQGQGVGRFLMEHVLRLGATRGITHFRSEVSITARPFYERFGFSVVTEQNLPIRGQILNNFIMEKIVLPN